jgi:hypothetical protein
MVTVLAPHFDLHRLTSNLVNTWVDSWGNQRPGDIYVKCITNSLTQHPDLHHLIPNLINTWVDSWRNQSTSGFLVKEITSSLAQHPNLHYLIPNLINTCVDSWRNQAPSDMDVKDITSSLAQHPNLHHLIPTAVENWLGAWKNQDFFDEKSLLHHAVEIFNDLEQYLCTIPKKSDDHEFSFRVAKLFFDCCSKRDLSSEFSSIIPKLFTSAEISQNSQEKFILDRISQWEKPPSQAEITSIISMLKNCKDTEQKILDGWIAASLRTQPSHDEIVNFIASQSEKILTTNKTMDQYFSGWIEEWLKNPPNLKTLDRLYKLPISNTLSAKLTDGTKKPLR